jgi:predicted DNA-binding transcriptional regulator AlpA
MSRADHHEAASEAAGRPIEADEPQESGTSLAAVLAGLMALLTRLGAALDRLSDRQPEPLAFRKRDAARMCGMAPRTLERLASAGRFPKPDAYAGKCPLWVRSTLEAWVARGGAQ